MGEQHSYDVSILGGMVMYMCHAWSPWILMFAYSWLWFDV